MDTFEKWVWGLFVGAVVLLIALALFMLHLSNEWAADCAARGGVQYRSVCIDKDVLR